MYLARCNRMLDIKQSQVNVSGWKISLSLNYLQTPVEIEKKKEGENYIEIYVVTLEFTASGWGRKTSIIHKVS